MIFFCNFQTDGHNHEFSNFTSGSSRTDLVTAGFCLQCSQMAPWPSFRYEKPVKIDVKNAFSVLFPPRFYVFNVFFYFVNVFYFKTCIEIENSIKKFEKHFWNHRKFINELIGLDYIMKVAGCRLQSSALSSAYSDTTAVTSYSRHNWESFLSLVRAIQHLQQ